MEPVDKVVEGAEALLKAIEGNVVERPYAGKRIFGVVKFFGVVGPEGKPMNYGFITPQTTEDGKPSKDCFVHYSEILGSGYKTLKAGDIVEFEIVPTPKGRSAHRVKIIKDYRD